MSFSNRILNKNHLDMDDEKTRKKIRNSYHGYFEGYTEIPVQKKKSTVLQREYEGTYYVPNLTKSRKIAVRIVYLLLLLLSTTFFIQNGLLPLECNMLWYVALPEAATIPFLFWGFISWFEYFSMKEKLTVVEFRRSSINIKKASLVAAICSGCSVLAMLIYCFLHLNVKDSLMTEFLCTLRYLVAGIALLAIYAIESKIKYNEIPSIPKPEK